MAIVWIPSLMRDLTGGVERVEAPGATVAEVIDQLEARYPGIRARLIEAGDVNPHVAIAIDGEVSSLGLYQPVGEKSEIHFLPAVSGGTTE